MMAVVLMTRFAPPARIRSASCCAAASSSAATRAVTASDVIPIRPATATALPEVRAAVTTARLSAGRVATAASSAALLVVLLACAVSGMASVMVAAVVNMSNRIRIDTQAPCDGTRRTDVAPRTPTIPETQTRNQSLVGTNTPSSQRAICAASTTEYHPNAVENRTGPRQRYPVNNPIITGTVAAPQCQPRRKRPLACCWWRPRCTTRWRRRRP